MKRNLTLLSFIFVLCSSKFIAQTYNALNLTGFNTDVIAETKPAAGSTSSLTIDAAGFVLFTVGYTGTVTTAGGLPASRTFTTASKTYSLAPYNAKNTLRVAFNTSDSLQLVTPGNYSVISLLGFSSGIDASTDITIKYTDGTFTTYNSKTFYSWVSTQPAFIEGFGRTNRASDAIYAVPAVPNDPKMFTIDLPIACANQSKTISKVVVKNNSNGATTFVFAISAVSRPNYTANSIPATCKGSSTGMAKALGIDMYGPVTYTWSSAPVQNTQTASNLPAGNYTVNITDGNGCTFTRTVAVTEPATSFSITSVNSNTIACGTGTAGVASVNASGGSTPYTYLWSNAATTATITGLSAGTYTVMATDANNCVMTGSATITAPAVAITVNTSSLLCRSTPNATATVGSITGAVAPYTYTWSSTPAQTTATATALPAGNYTVTVKDVNGCVNMQAFSILGPDFTITTAAASCTLANGSATVSGITGGSGAPYTYTWSPSGGNAAVTSSLSSGNYSVTVQDMAGCNTTKTLSIASLNPTLSVTTTSLLCGNLANGTASVNVSGGLGGPYTYTWNSVPTQTTAVASNLIAGSYNVTVKGVSGCVAIQSFTIAKPTLSIVTHSTSCKNLQATGGATVTSVNGGVGPYMYSWDGGLSMSSLPSSPPLDEGTYTLNVTDANNCNISTTFIITAPSTGSLSATVTTSATTCSGVNNGKAMVSGVIGGLAPYSYEWNTTPPQYTPLATGLPSPNTFICTIVDYNNCAINKTAIIYPAPANILIYVSPSATICPGKPVTLSLTGLTGAGTYTWSTGAHTSSITAIPTGSNTTTAYSFTGTTSYSCIVTGSTSVTTSSAACILGVEEQHGNVSYNLYPNPNNGQFVLALDQAQDNAMIEVIDALGKLVLSQNIIGTETTVNTSTLQEGIYFVTVKNKDRIIVRTKIIKQ